MVKLYIAWQSDYCDDLDWFEYGCESKACSKQIQMTMHILVPILLMPVLVYVIRYMIYALVFYLNYYGYVKKYFKMFPSLMNVSV